MSCDYDKGAIEVISPDYTRQKS